MYSVKYPPVKKVKGFKSQKDAAKWIEKNLNGRTKLDATIVNEDKVRDFVDSVLFKEEVDANIASTRMDAVISSINEFRKVIKSHPSFDREARKLEDSAKRIAINLNKMI